MKEKVYVLLSVYLTFYNAQADTRVDPLVDTKVGLIRGVSAADGNYSMFMGIPFGRVDAANPFGLSTPYPPFNGIFEAYDDSAICPQVEEINNTIVGTIDCLHLNVYVPLSATSANRLPVMVWIYGGGFVLGFAGRTLYGPKYLVRHDVIVVTVNYRLGPYGFMCLDTPEVPGNQGLKDQLLALRWINNNIESFGGDVNKITIFGESAGGKSVDLHLYSAQEQLFHSVIMQSGTALLPGLEGESDRTAPLNLAERLGFSTSDISQALSFLATVDPILVIEASSEVSGFNPCIEKDFENVEKFYVDYPYNVNIPKAKDMSILIGFNAEEWLGSHANQNEDHYSNWNEFRNLLLSKFDFEEKDLIEMTDIVRHFYIGDERISHDVRLKLAEFESDFLFNYPAERSVAKYIENKAEKVFYYMFSYVGNRNWVRWAGNITIGGAVHADEIGYLFDVSLWTDQPTTADQLIIDRITTMWTNFVKYGNPTPDISELLPVKWEPIISQESPFYFLNIDTELALGVRPYHERMAFWELFYNRNEEFQKGYIQNPANL